MRSIVVPGSLVAGAIALIAVAAPRASRAQQVDPESTNGTVVHVGDSFLDAGLRQALGPKFRGEHTRYIAQSKTSSYLGQWAFGTTLNELYWSWRPSLFLVTLGANEMRAAPETRVALIKKIVQELRGTPCVWVSVPIWKGETNALNEMIKRESLPCHYFDSSVVADKIERQSFDNIHPTIEGGAVWAEAFWTWLQNERDPSAGPWALKPLKSEETAPTESQ
jgi:hypothetical protein